MEINPDDVIPKQQLKEIINRFLKDKKRGIPIKLFAELCGVNFFHLRDVFLYQTEPLTENVQRRVSKGYNHWKNGDVAVMIRFGQKWLEWRKEPKPRMVKGYGLQLGNDGFKLKIGAKNRYDYSNPRLDEYFKGR